MADEVELLQVMCQGYSICFKLQLSDSWLRIHFSSIGEKIPLIYGPVCTGIFASI